MQQRPEVPEDRDADFGVAFVDVFHRRVEIDRQLSARLPGQDVLGQDLVRARDLAATHNE